jgi:hypothetical protein
MKEIASHRRTHHIVVAAAHLKTCQGCHIQSDRVTYFVLGNSKGMRISSVGNVR